MGNSKKWLNFIWQAIFLLTVCMIVPLYAKEKTAPVRTIRIFAIDGYIGEREFATRIVKAAANLNWRVVIEKRKKNISDIKDDFDWNLTFHPFKDSLKNQPDYLALFDPVKYCPEGHLIDKYHSYSGFLTTFSNTAQLIEDLNGDSNRIFKGWYPTVFDIPYRSVNPDHLFYIIAGWGNRRFEEKYLELQQLLAGKEFTNFYGFPKYGKKFGAAFKGQIPIDGESLIDYISESGVCLILHSEIHNDYHIPSGRIFEAVAASAVVISDLNDFVIDNFGDSVLYVDQNLSAEEIFTQIDNHMTWIKEHKEEALEMSRRAHQIFQERFTLEQQLLNLDAFHQRLIQNN